MANPWSIPATGWIVAVMGWLLSPIISLIVNKLFAYLIFDAPKELLALELDTVPALKVMLREVEEQRMLRAARDEGSRSELERLDKMDMHLKAALCEAEDILDLVDYHRIEKEMSGGGSGRGVHNLLDAAAACIVASCRGGWIRRCIDITPSLVTAVRAEHETEAGAVMRTYQPTMGFRCRRSTVGVQRICGWFRHLVANIVTSSCRAMLNWSSDRVADARYYRDWSYEQVGIKSNRMDGNAIEGLVPITERIRLRKQIKGIKDILSFSNRSDLLNQNSSISRAKDAAKESSSSCTIKNSAKESSSKQKEIIDLYRSIKQKVFGRDKDRAHICRMLRKGLDANAATSSGQKPYSVIGIYGISGSGKSTLAQYVCDYEKDIGHFHPIMFIHVGKTFSVGDIFHDMLEQITQSRPSKDKDLKSLKKELEEKLKDRCFLLVLDDLWIYDENQEEGPDIRPQQEILLATLCAGRSGSGILVTAQREDAAAALGAQEQISIPDLEDKEYMSLFMHHARPGTVNDHEEYGRIGNRIVKKLHRSPIAAVTVARRLQRNKNISFWETTANLDVLNKTMGALWWSYQQLGFDIRRCFAYCSTFPKGYVFKRDELIHIWIAQGFVNTMSSATEELEDVGQSYCDELLTFSFLQTERKIFDRKTEALTVHDLLHDLAERVSGSEFYRIVLNGSPKDIPRGVHHLFIETNNGAEMFEKIVDLENLRTLIIKETYAEPMETIKNKHDLEKVLDRLFMRLTKLRVLIIKPNCGAKEWLVPASIDQMKYLRYLGFHFSRPSVELILPSTFTKLYHIQIIDLPLVKAYCPEDMANLISLRHISALLSFPNVGRLISLQTLTSFTVHKEQGYGLKQLKHLNKLRGTLNIYELGIVGSKEEALEAHLCDKEGLRKLQLSLGWHMIDPDVEAEVLEGLCPPKDLEELNILCYNGSRYPSWMLSRHHPYAPKNLHKLELFACSHLASFPENSDLFVGLRELYINSCRWDRLPENMQGLVSLQTLTIYNCTKMELLPTLPQHSLKKIRIDNCSMLSTTCKEKGHQNWYKIQHIPEKYIDR